MKSEARHQPSPQVAPSPSTGPRNSRIVSSLVGAPLGWGSVGLRVRLARAYNWALWLLLTTILFVQFLGVIWSHVTSTTHFHIGQDPQVGKYSIPGFNDEPYSDRAVACVKRGQYYQPIQLSQLLLKQAQAPAPSFDNFTTNGIDGYRVVPRDSFTMDATSFSFYKRQCSTLTLTLDSIFKVCEVLGYNVTRDFLRVVNSLEDDNVQDLPTTLPVVIIPYWDRGALSRYIVPGIDGSACVFRGSGVFEFEGAESATMTALPRALRESKTKEWLGYLGGVWRNGWYEDPVVHMRWYSDLISTLPSTKLGIHARKFDLTDGGRELDCSRLPYGCGGGVSTWSWNEQLHMDVDDYWIESIAVSNGSRFGLFYFDARHVQTIKSRYSLDKLLSNMSFAVLLSRWMVAMLAVAPTTIGIGAVANSRSLHLLPFFLLPRLKSALEAFWASGCSFEGDERALADAWFEVYPAIGEVVMIYFSLLNSISKLLRRRTSDVLFGPTLLFLGFLHYFRAEIAALNILEFDKRISTVVTADEVAAASLVDFFVTDLAFRMNGKIQSLYTMKLVVLGLNVLPLLFFSRTTSDDWTKHTPLDVESALARRFVANGGLGSTTNPYVSGKVRTLRPYELVRGGYVVIVPGPSVKTTSKLAGILVAMPDWFWLLATIPLRHFPGVAIRIVEFELLPQPSGAMALSEPRVVAVNEARISGWITPPPPLC